MVVAFLLIIKIVDVSSEVACYHCYGNSTEKGQHCSIDKLCLGEGCFFTSQSTGEWSAGCSSVAAPPSVVCSKDGDASTCRCTADLCNQFDSASSSLSSVINVTLHQPALPVNCFECGNVSIAGRFLSIPCDKDHICKGEYCVIKRGANPHSYCGTSWEGSSEARCFKNPGEEQQCVCPQAMCNAMLTPEIIRLLTTKAASSTATMPTTTTTTMATNGSAIVADEPPKKKCKNGMKFSPNAQAVFMGQKLGNIFSGGLTTDTKSVQELAKDVDTHICE
ncbi:hypothetical protein Q1695_004977 [Nippostrongylus brasiliensis]|nr:hypothetical protein Q1695_004977 [Nippostrongylus brasiliensis]